MAISCATHDVGMLSLFLFGLEEREKILSIFEHTTGARMHLNYYIPGGVYSDITPEIILEVQNFINNINFYIKTVQVMALNNRIFQKRTIGVGIISSNFVKENGITGPNARASGIKIDLRKHSEFKYGVYERLSFNIITLTDGDCYSRIKIRFEEIKQSINLIKQCISQIPTGSVHNYFAIKATNEKGLLNNTIKEAIYSHFFENGIDLPIDTKVYRSIEGARGELGIFICTTANKTNKPFRLHIRAPSFAHIQLLEQILVNTNIQDATAIIGSLDFVMGECDR
jgi:NADH-quinone oxidoreductase subunit D